MADRTIKTKMLEALNGVVTCKGCGAQTPREKIEWTVEGPMCPECC
jgi:hypothetical protein